jgi:hypothetical protein
VRRADHSGSDVSGGIISSSSLDDRNSSILSLKDPITESSLPWNAPRLAARSIMLTVWDRSWYEMLGFSDMIRTVVILASLSTPLSGLCTFLLSEVF